MDSDRDDPGDRRRSYSVPVAGVGGRRHRPWRTAVIVLAVVAALVAGGVMSSRLFPVVTAVDPSALAPASAVALVWASASPGGPASPRPSPRATASTRPAASASPVAVTPIASMTPRGAGKRADATALVAAIPLPGEGPLAFVTGRLRSEPQPCDPGAPLSACVSLSIEGLRGVTVIPDDTLTAWPGDPPAGEALVLLARDGQLVFLGALAVAPAGIPRIDVLGARLAADPLGYEPSASLHEVNGLLLSGGAACTGSGTCYARAPDLLIVPPKDAQTANSAEGALIQVAPGAFGVDLTALRTPGPFLVRRRADPVSGRVSWEVVAREDQASIVHVVIP